MADRARFLWVLVLVLGLGSGVAPAWAAGVAGGPLIESAPRASRLTEPTFFQRLRANLAEGLALRSGAVVAYASAERITNGVAPAMVKVLERFVPRGVAAPLVSFVADGLGMMAFAGGMQFAQGVRATGSTKGGLAALETRALIAAGIGSAVGRRLLGALIPGPIGGWVGSWLGWSLASGLANQSLNGRPLSLKSALSDIDLGRLMVQMLATEGAALFAPRLVGRLLGGLPTGALGLVTDLASQVVFASVSSAVATAGYDALKHRGPGAARHGKPASPETTVATDLAVRDSYELYIKAATDPKVATSQVQAAYDRYRSIRDRLATQRANHRP